MKKNGLLKTILVIILMIVVASYIIPSRSEVFKTIALVDGTANILPFGEILLSWFQSFYIFFDILFFVLIVGGFYGILNKIPSYKNTISKIASGLKENNKMAIIVCTVLFATIGMVTGIDIPMFIFIPLAIAIILEMGNDKIVAVSSTVVALLIGLMNSIFFAYRSRESAYSEPTFNTFEKFTNLNKLAPNYIMKTVLFVTSLVLLILYIVKYMNKNEKKATVEEKEKEEKKKLKDEYQISLWPMIIMGGILVKYITIILQVVLKIPTTKFWIFTYASICNIIIIIATVVIAVLFGKKKEIKSNAPIITIIIFMFVITILGLIPWNEIYGVSLFEEIHTAVVQNYTIPEIGKLKEFSIMDKVFSGSFAEFGSWGVSGSYMILTSMIMMISILIKFVYRIKFDDMVESFVEGAKKVVPTILIISVAYVVLICTANIGFYDTLVNIVGNNAIAQSMLTIFGNVLFVDMYYTVLLAYQTSLNAVTDHINVLALAFQSIHYLVSLIGPTSLLLIMTLTYVDLSYKKWIKYIFRLFLVLLCIVLLALVILSLI